MGPAAQADCGLGVHAGGRFAADRRWIQAEWGDSHVSCGEPGTGCGDGQSAGLFGGGFADRGGTGGESATGTDRGDRAGSQTGSDGRRAGTAGDVPVWRGDDGGAPDPGADDVGSGPGGGYGAPGTAGVNGSGQ